MHMSGRTIHAIALAMVAAACGVLVSSPGGFSRPVEGEAKTWMRSGRRLPLAALEGRRTKMLLGTCTPLCSAKEVRALAVQNDTVWIGTEGGLFAYGVRSDSIASVSGPASISVRTIAFDNGGVLWVGGDGGLSARAPGGWRQYVPISNPFFSRVRCLTRGETRFWIGTYGNGCANVANDHITILTRADSLLDERVLSIAEETPNTVMLGTASGLVIADTLGWKSMRYGSRIPLGAVNDLLFDEEGDLYLCIAEQGVAIYSFGRVRTFGSGSGGPGEEVNALGLDPTGRVWAAGNGGLFTFDGTEWSPYPLASARPMPHRFLSVEHDEEGTCYAGTDEGTVLVASRDTVKEVALPQRFPEQRVARVRFCNGSVWLIAGRSLYRLAEKLETAPAPPALYADEMTDLLATEGGDIWVTTRFGILHYAGREWEIFDRKNGLPTEYFTAISRDAQGTLWFSSFDRGVLSLASGVWTAYGRTDGLPGNVIADMVIDGAGTPWIVTQNGEVARFAQGAWRSLSVPLPGESQRDTSAVGDSLLHIDPAIHFLPEAGLSAGGSSGGSRFCLGLDRAGNCLVGTGSGVCRFSGGRWQAMVLPRAMRGFRPTCVVGTGGGEIWVGTAGSGLLVYRNGEWFACGPSTGLSDTYIRSLCQDASGVIWIGTQFGGLTRVSLQGGM
jgi:ligand-binding sensor domain-containing protein